MKAFALLSFDARSYGASSQPRRGRLADEELRPPTEYVLNALSLDTVLVHGTSMGGIIAIAFTASSHGERTIAACANVAFAEPDVYRRHLFRIWRRIAENHAVDDFSDHVTTQAVSARSSSSQTNADSYGR